jgi:hypothetical protein
VAFEVGVAAGCQKPVWVFEEFGYNIISPIQFVTNYCRYQMDYNNEFLRYIRNILVGKGPHPNQIGCPNCYASYRYWNREAIEYCPICRFHSLKGEIR